MSEAIILGSGTSNGVPMLGVEYAPEYLANPKNHRTRSSLLLKGPQGNLLVDCSPEMRLQITRENVLDVEAVLITHTHADHVMGMDDLRSFSLRSGMSMPVYTLPKYQADIRRIFPYAFKEFPDGIFVPRFDLRDVPELPGTLDVGGMRVSTFLVRHGPTDVIAVRVGGFAYITDVSEIPKSSEPFLCGLDTLVIDGLRRKQHPNHFSLSEALDVIERVQPGQAYLTHLTHDYDHDVTNAELPAGVELAYDGLRIPISDVGSR